MTNVTSSGHILITGAAKRIGRALALAFGRAGWFVTIHYNASAKEAQNTLDELRQAGGEGQALSLDLAATQNIDAFIARVQAEAPPLDALINNASLFELDDCETATTAALEKHHRVNAVAPILLSRAFAHRVRDAGRTGVVINMLDNKIFAPNPDYLSYSVSKYGLYGATEMLAMALAPDVRVCGIAPGVTFVSGVQSDADYEETKAINPLKRGVDVEDICAAALFLANAKTVTGEIIAVDGGQKLLKLDRDVAFITKE